MTLLFLYLANNKFFVPLRWIALFILLNQLLFFIFYLFLTLSIYYLAILISIFVYYFQVLLSLYIRIVRFCYVFTIVKNFFPYIINYHYTFARLNVIKMLRKCTVSKFYHISFFLYTFSDILILSIILYDNAPFCSYYINNCYKISSLFI